jgi:nucleotide-binding universal stress UspA family protein
MSLRSIFLFAPAETARSDRGAPAFAIGLAKAQGASLTVFCVALDVTTPGRRSDASEVAGRICETAQAAGVDCVTVTEHSHAIGVHEAVAEYARLHDLTVAGCEGGGLLSERLITEYLLFDSGRPVLLVPGEYTAPYVAGTAAFAWDNTAVAARALGDGLALLDIDAARLLTIEGDKTLHGALEADAVRSALDRRGVAASLVSAGLDGRTIARALQDEAARSDASLLVMGAVAHSRLRRLVLGSATADLLKNPRMPVLLSH